MSQPVHTPGPVIARPRAESEAGRITITGAYSPVPIAEIASTTAKGCDPLAEANGRLLAAAYNAFDSAAAKLGVNAVELAERMADGGIADLAQAIENLMPEVEAEIEQRQESGDEEYWMPLDSLAADVRGALRKTKGDAS